MQLSLYGHWGRKHSQRGCNMMQSQDGAPDREVAAMLDNSSSVGVIQQTVIGEKDLARSNGKG